MSLSISITIPDIGNISQHERDVLMSILGIAPVTQIAQESSSDNVAAKIKEQLPSVVAFIPPAAPAAPTAPVTPENAFAAQVLAPAAPIAPSAILPTPQLAGGIELDKNSLPWDGRIHSKERTKNQDGSWRNKRGVDVVTLTAVETELKGVMAAPVTAPVVPEPVASAAMSAVPVASAAMSAVPVASAAMSAVPVVTADSPFATFMTKITPLIVAKTLTQEMIVQTVQKHSLPHLGALSMRPDLIAQVQADIEQLIGRAL